MISMEEYNHLKIPLEVFRILSYRQLQKMKKNNKTWEEIVSHIPQRKIDYLNEGIREDNEDNIVKFGLEDLFG